MVEEVNQVRCGLGNNLSSSGSSLVNFAVKSIGFDG